MTEEAQPGHTDTSGRIIESLSGPQPQYFSEKIGRDYGSPSGGWTPDRTQATVMTQEKAQHLLEGALAPFAHMTLQAVAP